MSRRHFKGRTLNPDKEFPFSGFFAKESHLNSLSFNLENFQSAKLFQMGTNTGLLDRMLFEKMFMALFYKNISHICFSGNDENFLKYECIYS